MKNKWITNASVVLSGASSGIGRGIAKTLINKYNCNVIGIGRNEAKMLSLLDELGEKKDNFSYYLFDVSSLEGWTNMRADLEAKGKEVDVLINNAGILPPFKRFETQELNDIENVININFYSCVYSIKTLLPLLEKSAKGAVINVCSSASLTPLAGISGYTASKGALKNFTESLQLEYKHRLYVGAIYPGFTRTEIFRMQTAKIESKLINIVSTSCDKMVKKCVRGIVKRKKRMVLGFDAKTMNLLYKFAPVSSLNLFDSVLKASKIELFMDVYK